MISRQKIFFYKMTTDNGGAPTVSGTLLSLAICKPMIRSSARKGSIIFGFGARSTIGERLIYIAEVTDKLFSGNYYKKDEYKNRKDCIYYWQKERLIWKPDSLYHSDGSEILRDVGMPPHDKAKVLLSINFRYLGNKGTEDYKDKYPAIAGAVFKLGQGHRVNHSKMLYSELLKLKREIWEQYPDEKVIGAPIDSDTSKICSGCEGKIAIMHC